MDDANGGSLLDYARLLHRRRRLLLWLVGTAFFGSLVVSLVLPRTYAATATVLPPQQEPVMPVMTMGKAALGPLNTAASSLLGGSTPSDLWVGILEDEAVADAIIGRFQLRSYFDCATLEDTRKKLAKRVRIDSSREGIVSVTVETREPRLSASLANAYVEELDRINRRALTTSGGRMRAFVEQRLGETRQALGVAEDRLKVFQKGSRAVQIDTQSQAIIESFARLKAELATKEVELRTLLSMATAEHPRVAILEREVGEIKRQLRQLEQGNPEMSDIFLPTDRVPDLGVQYARLLRDVKYQESLLELLVQQYEMARIQEAKDTPTVQVLHAATVPEERTGPRRARLVFGSTAAGLFLGVFAVFGLEYVEAQRRREGAAR